jgi:TPP-dependent pyruvate/acetoin dehydrogenase alpha subunit
MLSAGITARDGALALDRAARAEMDDAIDFALASPFPAPELALEDVFT